VLEAARVLLGSVFEVDDPQGTVAVRLSEVEAYAGVADPASHAFRGRTRRNAVMFGPAAHLYVYFVYGMHWCANVVAAPAGCPEAVLLRALEPVAGLELMRRRRGAGIPDRNLARGPANLCQALGITGAMNGADLVSPGAFLADGALARGERIARTTRIGVDYAGAHAKKPWRFLIAESPFVSKPPRLPARA
jgi:DNA-3-methyladenine glycosylase